MGLSFMLGNSAWEKVEGDYTFPVPAELFILTNMFDNFYFLFVRELVRFVIENTTTAPCISCPMY